MYKTHFGFSELPFALTPNPRFMYMSHYHKEALAHLLYGINNRHGFMCLAGEVGTGKTTLLRALLGRLQDQYYRTALIFNPCLTAVELLRSVNREFGISSSSNHSSELLHILNHYLLSETSLGHKIVLIIDEAQNLQSGVLEQVRLISNLETENDKLIQIILAGQPELGKLLKKPDLRQLEQRIAVRYTLKPLNLSETGEYIRHRIEIAGNGGSVAFSNSAVWLIHLHSGGIPRMINILCERALLNAYIHERLHISAWTVLRVIWELRELPTLGRGREPRPAAPAKKQSPEYLSGRKASATGTDSIPAQSDATLPAEAALAEIQAPSHEQGTADCFIFGEELRLEPDDLVPADADTSTAQSDATLPVEAALAEIQAPSNEQGSVDRFVFGEELRLESDYVIPADTDSATAQPDATLPAEVDVMEFQAPNCEYDPSDCFDLGEELRLELDDVFPAGNESDSELGLSLHSMIKELHDPELKSDALLLVLRFASEFFERSVVFVIHEKSISGVGQFGIASDTESGDDRVRAIGFSLEPGSMFHTPQRTARAITFRPEPTTVDRLIFDQLGGGIPDEAFIGPIVGRSGVIGYLYGDNLPAGARIGRTESMGIFLSLAGVALEKILLERRLQAGEPSTVHLSSGR